MAIYRQKLYADRSVLWFGMIWATKKKDIVPRYFSNFTKRRMNDFLRKKGKNVGYQLPLPLYGLALTDATLEKNI